MQTKYDLKRDYATCVKRNDTLFLLQMKSLTDRK